MAGPPLPATLAAPAPGRIAADPNVGAQVWETFSREDMLKID
jgi:hypothetical protein